MHKIFGDYFTTMEQRKAEEEERRVLGKLKTLEKFDQQKTKATQTHRAYNISLLKKVMVLLLPQPTKP